MERERRVTYNICMPSRWPNEMIVGWFHKPKVSTKPGLLWILFNRQATRLLLKHAVDASPSFFHVPLYSSSKHEIRIAVNKNLFHTPSVDDVYCLHVILPLGHIAVAVVDHVEP